MKRWTERREVLALAVLVGVSFTLRLLGGLGQSTITLIPDEYTYSELSRSLALDHAPLIRGAFAHFPSLAFPLLSAPLWVFSDPELVYKLTKALNALIASLAAVPAFLLARELRLRPVARLGVTALALAVPGLCLASYVGTDVLGYTLALCALLVGIRALDQPTPRRLAIFVGFAALASFARLQYVVFIPVFIAAWALLDSREVLTLLRRHLVACAAIVAALAAVFVAVGSRNLLGGYGDVFSFDIRPLDTARWISIDLLVLAFAVGVAVVPGAIAGLAVSLAQPRRRLERAFSLFVLLFFLSLLVEAALFGSNVTGEVEERYMFAISPALSVAFALAIERAPRLALAVSVVATAVLVAFLRFPLTAYDQPSQVAGSPFLKGVLRLDQQRGPGDAALLLTTIAVGLLLLGALAFFRPRFLMPIAFLGAVVFAGSFSVLSTLQTNERSKASVRTFLPKDFDRIDDLVSEPVGLVVTVGTPRPLACQLMFWNRSIGDPINLPGSRRIDSYGRRSGKIAADGRLLVEGKPWRGPLLVSDYASRSQLRDARVLLHGLTSNLWQPRAEARFALMSKALYFDDWLASANTTTIWPDESGRLRGKLEVKLAPPPGVKWALLTIETPWRSYRAKLAAGSSKKFSIALRGNRPAVIAVHSNRIGGLGDGRILIAKAQFRLVENEH